MSLSIVEKGLGDNFTIRNAVNAGCDAGSIHPQVSNYPVLTLSKPNEEGTTV